MAKSKAFPKQLFVKHETDRDLEYFSADLVETNFAEIGEKTRIGVYELVETREIEGVITSRTI